MEGFRGSETPAGSLLGAFRVSRQGCGARDGWVYRVYIGLFRQITAFLVYCLRGSSPEKLTFMVVFRLLTETRVEADVTLSHLRLPEFCSATSTCSQVLFSLILPRI